MILILGGGFIGTALAERLIADGRRVRMFSRGAPPATVSDFVRGSLRDIGEYPELFVGIKAVVHCIHTSVPSNSNTNVVAEIEGNLLPTLRMLQMMKANGVGTLVYLSSGGAIYGAMSEPATEDHVTLPISGYGVTKLAMEHYLRLHQLQGILRTLVVLRPANVYGPGQRLSKPQGVIGHMLRAVRTGQPFQRWGDGTATKDYLHISDMVEAIRLAIGITSESASIFNVSSGVGHSLNEIVAHVEQALGRPLAIEAKPALVSDIPYVVLDHRRLTSATGWQPQTDLRTGIAALVRRTASSGS